MRPVGSQGRKANVDYRVREHLTEPEIEKLLGAFKRNRHGHRMKTARESAPSRGQNWGSRRSCWALETSPLVSEQCAPRTFARQLQNIRLSSDAANPLSTSRNQRADGDGCVEFAPDGRSCARLQGCNGGTV